MSDLDRDREPDTTREREHVTVIDTGRRGDGDRRGLAIVAAVLLLGLAAIVYFVVGGGARDAADEVGVNVSVPIQAPDINVNLPDVNIDPSKVELPDADVKADADASGNAAR